MKHETLYLNEWTEARDARKQVKEYCEYYGNLCAFTIHTIQGTDFKVIAAVKRELDARDIEYRIKLVPKDGV